VRKLASEGTLRLGEVAYAIVATEKIETNKKGVKQRTYNVRHASGAPPVIEMKATSTTTVGSVSWRSRR